MGEIRDGDAASGCSSRGGHADLDPSARERKARKIVAVLRGSALLDGARVLDIGTGSGRLASTLASIVGTRGEVWGVDVIDQREPEATFNFQRVKDDAELPFEAGSFDVVVSNHVIEHVGDVPRQRTHVEEIARVLRPGGVAYLATPNRWGVIEPHYHLPFLSWVPAAYRSAVVRRTGRGGVYDCTPLSRRELEAMFARASLAARDASVETMRAMAAVEVVGPLRRAVLRAPEPVVRLARPVIPTMVYLATRRHG